MRRGVKGLNYASVDADDKMLHQNATLGILQDDRTGPHELIGLPQMLNDSIKTYKMCGTERDRPQPSSIPDVCSTLIASLSPASVKMSE